MTRDGQLRVDYLGWSGFRITGPGGAGVYVDPPSGAALARDRPVHVLITHGHPEHLGGTVEHLRRRDRSAPVFIAASPGVGRYLRRRSAATGVHVRACEPGQHFEFAGFDIDVFPWRHMPLLPPGAGAAARHIRCLLSRPTLVLAIVAAGLRGPWPHPMLGFRLACPGGGAILVYGEGLHRRAARAEVERIGAALPADVLLAAVEPEDVDALPELIVASGAISIGLYQAHQPWRERFGMPLADLDALARTLAARGREPRIFRAGAGGAAETFSIPARKGATRCPLSI